MRLIKRVAMSLTGGVSMGVHESQSRLWENLVARSRPFWRRFHQELRDAFPGVLDGVALETIYRAVNAVRPSEIRTEADELTYDLHVLLSFELELDLFKGGLSVGDPLRAVATRYATNAREFPGAMGRAGQPSFAEGHL